MNHSFLNGSWKFPCNTWRSSAIPMIYSLSFESPPSPSPSTSCNHLSSTWKHRASASRGLLYNPVRILRGFFRHSPVLAPPFPPSPSSQTFRINCIIGFQDSFKIPCCSLSQDSLGIHRDSHGSAVRILAPSRGDPARISNSLDPVISNLKTKTKKEKPNKNKQSRNTHTHTRASRDRHTHTHGWFQDSFEDSFCW